VCVCVCVLIHKKKFLVLDNFILILILILLMLHQIQCIQTALPNRKKIAGLRALVELRFQTLVLSN